MEETEVQIPEPAPVTPAPAVNDGRVQDRPGQKTTHIRNADGELIAWDTIREMILVQKRGIPEIAEELKLKRKTLYEKASREKWKIIRIAKVRARAKLARKVVDKIMNGEAEKIDWNKKGETHRGLAFKIAHESVKKFKPRAPKNFRELEAADKIARRAAGLEVAEVQQNTLIQVNELINEAEPQVLEAHEVPPAIEVTEQPQLQAE